MKINAAKTVNKTLEADGKQYDDREKTVPTDVEDKLSGNSAAENNPLNQDKLLEIGSLKVSSKIYKLNNDPSAKYLIETNKKYADYLNKLGEIFDKTKVEERQELAGLFGEVAFNQIHYMKGTKEQKALYHALVGGIMSKLTSGDFLAGASATAINKLVIGEIEKIAGKDPAIMQWLSAALGGVISEVVSKNAEAGAGAASSATKNNDLEQELSAEF